MCGRRFTLLELLVVVSVVMILAGILLPILNKSRERARAAAKFGSCMAGAQNKNSGCVAHFTFGEGSGFFTIDWASGRRVSFAAAGAVARWEGVSRVRGDWGKVPFDFALAPGWLDANLALMRGSDHCLACDGDVNLDTPNLSKSTPELSVEVWLLLAGSVSELEIDGNGWEIDVDVSSSGEGSCKAKVNDSDGGEFVVSTSPPFSHPNIPVNDDATAMNLSTRWLHVVFSYKTGGVLSGFLNGKPFQSVPAGAAIAASSSGRLSISSEGGTTLIDEIVVYNRALPKDEVADLYNVGKPRGCPEDAPR